MVKFNVFRAHLCADSSVAAPSHKNHRSLLELICHTLSFSVMVH